MFPHFDDPLGMFGNKAPTMLSFLKDNFFTISLSIFLVALFYLLRSRLAHDKDMLEKFNKLPGAPPSMVLGNAGIFMGDPIETPRKMDEYFRRYGRCARFWKINSPYVMISDPAVTERILSSPKQIEKGDGYRAAQTYMGQGLLAAAGEKWRKDRKKLNAGLKHSLFESFLEPFNRHAEVLVDKLRNAFTENPSSQDIFHFLGNCTLNVLCETSLGQPEESDNLSGTQILDGIGALLAGMCMRIFKPWMALPLVWKYFGNAATEEKYLKTFQKNIMKYVDKQRKDQLSRKLDTNYEDSAKSILDILLEAESNRSDADIYDHIITFMVGGTDTTANCLNYTLYLLAFNPHHQQKVQEELDSIFANRGEGEKSVSMGDLAEMKYMEMCIKESLRLYPPVPLFSRMLQSDIHLEDKLCIPKGVTVMIWPYFLQRDPKYFPNPGTFDPERFTSEASSKRHFYSYIPFSAGMRNCIGQRFGMMEMKVALAHILNNFKVTTTKPLEELKVIFRTVLEPAGGIQMTLTPR